MRLPCATNKPRRDNQLPCAIVLSDDGDTRSARDLKKGIHRFGETLTVSDQVNKDEMQWCVNGLSRSDLLNEKKKAALTDISNHKQGIFDRACGCPQHATVINRYMVVGIDGNLVGTTSTDRWKVPHLS